MQVRNKFAIIGYRILFLLVCGYGLYNHLGFTTGGFKPSILLYYTILSNLVCFIYILGCLMKNVMDFSSWKYANSYVLFPRYKGAITMCITITMLVYQFVLVPTIFTMSPEYKVYSLNDLVVHFFVPGMIILDWLLFDVKRIFRKFEPLVWLVLPLAYLIFSLVRGYFGGPITPSGSKYPYFFLDIDKLGIVGVGKYVLILTILSIVLGYIILFIDYILGKGNHRRGYTKRTSTEITSYL